MNIGAILLSFLKTKIMEWYKILFGIVLWGIGVYFGVKQNEKYRRKK